MWDWDDAKRQANLAKHGVDFALVDQFDWSLAFEGPDTRHDYGEVRIRALGLIGQRVHVLIYTARAGAWRVISLRKANDREYQEWINHAE